MFFKYVCDMYWIYSLCDFIKMYVHVVCIFKYLFNNVI